MALRGNLKDFSLPDVFQLVTLSGKTGVLRIRRDEATGSVWFRDGEVYFAQSDWQAEPIGARLVSAGRVTPGALTRALEIQSAEPAEGRRLGQVLVDEGYISDKVLEAFVQEQIQDTIFDLFRWDDGQFDFEGLEASPAEDIGLSVSIENIVMEGSRRLEEWNRIKKKIPSMEIVFKMATAPGEGTFDISLKPTEWNLLLKVDGTRSVSELARELGRTDFEVARVIYGLFSAGLLEVASDEEVERLRAERVAWESRLAAEREIRDAERAAAEVIAAAEEAQVTEHAESVSAPADLAEPHVVEEPAYLTARSPSADDMAVFEQMMGAVLEAPEVVEEPASPSVSRKPPAPAPPISEDLEVYVPAEVEIADVPPLPPVVEASETADVRAAGSSEPAEAEEPTPADGVSTLEPAMLDEGSPPPEAEELPTVEDQESVFVEAPEAGVKEPQAPEPTSLENAGAPALELDVEEFEPIAAPSDEQPLHELLEALGAMAQPEAEADSDDGSPALIVETSGDAGLTGDFATDLMALGLGEAPETEYVSVVPTSEEPSEPEVAVSGGVLDAAQLAGLLSSLEEEKGSAVLPSVLGSEPLDLGSEEDLASSEPGEPHAVMSTDTYQAGFPPAASGLTGGMGDELTALTGGGTGRVRPQATAAKLPENGETVLRRDSQLDRALVERIIEGVKKI